MTCDSSTQDTFDDIPEATAIDDSCRQGSTKLHLDMSCALNLMTTDISGRGSLWTIFAAEDTESLRRFLRRKYELGPSSPCPIHAQRYFLRQTDLRALFLEEGVLPYIFTQKKGQAVIIPVGCAHQVSNLSKSRLYFSDTKDNLAGQQQWRMHQDRYRFCR